MAHANPRLTPAGGRTLVRRISAQPRRPIARIAHRRLPLVGSLPAARPGRLARPASIPAHRFGRTAIRLEQPSLRLRRPERLGPVRIAARMQLRPLPCIGCWSAKS
jgi:hypothetical protein